MPNPTTFKRTLHYYWQELKKYPGLIVAFFTLVTLAVLLEYAAMPYLISQLIDKLWQYAQGAAQTSEIYGLFWLLAASEVIQYVFWRVFSRMFVFRQAVILRDLEQIVFAKLISKSYRFFANSFTGALVAQANRFVKAFEYLTDIFIWEIYTGLIRFLSSLIILVVLLPMVGAIFLIWSVIFIACVLLLSKWKMKLYQAAAEADSEITGSLSDTITNMFNVIVFARQTYELSKYKNLSNKRFHIRWRAWRFEDNIRVFLNTAISLLLIGILASSIYLVINGLATPGLVVLAFFYTTRVTYDLWELSSIARRVETALADAAEMTAILDAPVDIKDPAKPIKPVITKGEVEFKDVSFAYDEAGQEVFTNFSLKVNAGEKVGLVGHSGSGKTTLTKILLRFADVVAGEVLVDGQNIAQMKLDDLRGLIAYVPQEPILFHRSLSENIRYGRPEATDDEVIKVAKLAHAHEFIKDLPNGYDTLVGERGIKLSGGQKQRVAIARAMLSKAPILILDEATSSLDAISEKFITEALGRLMKNRTTIVIAHRLSTIKSLDRIVVLQKGQTMEEGTHDELLARGGHYAELWSHQTGTFLE